MEKESGRDMLGNELLKFFTIQNLRAESGEISTETIKNYLKPIKLFCEMNRITINWKIISKRIKKETDTLVTVLHRLMKSEHCYRIPTAG